MPRRVLVLLMVIVLCVPLGALAGSPVPEANFAKTIVPSACTSDAGNIYEEDQFNLEGWSKNAAGQYVRYPGVCQRLRFAFGPIHIKPGQNDVLIQPITIEKPAYDGYITRFKPDLVRVDGSIPPIEEVHLHHGTWISFTTNYGSGPFFASGEEKTIADFPRGYGFPILGTDQWELLYMVHNFRSVPDEVWITYDIDYIAKADGDALELTSIYPIWLDVRPSSYPVFNVQRSFGGTDGKCAWPKEQCAKFNSWGQLEVGQGLPGNNLGKDYRLPKAGVELGRLGPFNGGTLIGLGGHVHPGGLSDEVELVRGADDAGLGGQSQMIFISDAKYWDWNDPTKIGGPPTSWDMSMTVTGLPRWAVHVKPGDRLRLNAVYDTTMQSTYENMGIVVSFIAPDVPDPSNPGQYVSDVPNAIDPFDDTYTVDTSETCASGGIAADALCLKGVMTHGHMAEADNHGGAGNVPIPSGAMSTHTDHVAIAGFKYLPGDLGAANQLIPTVTPGQTLEFVNADAAANIYHTITSCAYPCTGSTGIAFPISDGSSSISHQLVDFDSGELGYGPPFVPYELQGTSPFKEIHEGGSRLNFGPAKNTAFWGLEIKAADGFFSDEMYTYFCRIHAEMRGVFAVE